MARIREGFPGQRLRVLPPSVVWSALDAGLTRRLLVTDAGYYPKALHHGATRSHGANGTVVIIAAAGRGSCRSDDVVHRVGAGQALVIPAQKSHRYWADDDDPWTIWWMHVRGEDAQVFENMVVSGGAPTLIDIYELLRVVGDLERVVDSLEADETAPSLLRAAGAAWSVLAQLVADQASGSRVHTEPVRAAQEYLRTHLDGRVQVAELARLVGLSTSHFAALFRGATGGGIIDYLKRLRMARACELLRTTDLSVSEIARSVGYSDAFYFSRQFRGVQACSPTQFRTSAWDWQASSRPDV